MSASRAKYPWDEWTDGERHTIFRGRDYSISTYSMQISLHARARTHGLKVRSKSVRERRTDKEGLMEMAEGLRFWFEKP